MVNLNSPMEIAMRDLTHLIELANARLETLPGPVSNVTGFGAVGDGVTDCTAAIQKAINSLAPSGGYIYFPSGVYVVSDTITMPYGSSHADNDVGLRICGQGSTNTIILFKGTGTLFDFRGTSDNRKQFSLRDMQIRTDVAITTYKAGTIGLDMEWNTRNTDVSNVDFRNFEIGVRLRNNWIIQFNQVNTRGCDVGIDSGANAFKITGGEHISPNSCGIRLNGGNVITIDSVTIETTTMVDGNGRGIEFLNGCSRITIINPWFEALKGECLYFNGGGSRTQVIGGRVANDQEVVNPSMADIRVVDQSVFTAGTALILIGCLTYSIDLGGSPGDVVRWAYDIGAHGAGGYVNARPMFALKYSASNTYKLVNIGTMDVVAEGNQVIQRLMQDNAAFNHKFQTWWRSGVEVGGFVVTPSGEEWRMYLGGDNVTTNRALTVTSAGDVVAPRSFRLTPASSTGIPNNSFFVDSGDNLLKFKDNSGSVKTVTLA